MTDPGDERVEAAARAKLIENLRSDWDVRNWARAIMHQAANEIEVLAAADRVSPDTAAQITELLHENSKLRLGWIDANREKNAVAAERERCKLIVTRMRLVAPVALDELIDEALHRIQSGDSLPYTFRG